MYVQVYKLEPKAYDKQVQQFVQNKQFDLALEVAVSALHDHHMYCHMIIT